MTAWLVRSLDAWWNAAVSTMVAAMDADDAVWEPFLAEDEGAVLDGAW